MKRDFHILCASDNEDIVDAIRLAVEDVPACSVSGTIRKKTLTLTQELTPDMLIVDLNTWDDVTDLYTIRKRYPSLHIAVLYYHEVSAQPGIEAEDLRTRAPDTHLKGVPQRESLSKIAVDEKEFTRMGILVLHAPATLASILLPVTTCREVTLRR